MAVIYAVANEDLPFEDTEDVYILARGANVEEAKETLFENLNETYDVYRYEILSEDAEDAVNAAVKEEEIADLFASGERIVWLDEDEARRLSYVLDDYTKKEEPKNGK